VVMNMLDTDEVWNACIDHSYGVTIYRSFI